MLESRDRFCALVRAGDKIFPGQPVDSVADLTTLIIVVIGIA